jgi:hypothetical protein
MSNIPLDVERRCGQRSAARFEAAGALRHQHVLGRQQQQQPPRITTKVKPVLAGQGVRPQQRQNEAVEASPGAGQIVHAT